MVNCSLQRIRSQMRQAPVVSLSDYTASREPVAGDSAESHLSAKELMKLVMLLPPAYKMIFNLYVFEGYKHGEIASMLGISEGTSKSNLSDARAFLQKLLKKNKILAR
jgi:RNA polymerase sigma-70 factor, ECF subfamily